MTEAMVKMSNLVDYLGKVVDYIFNVVCFQELFMGQVAIRI